MHKTGKSLASVGEACAELHLLVDGPVLCTKAGAIALQLGIDDVNVSHIWLARLNTRHDLVFHSICKEAAAVDIVGIADTFICQSHS